MPEITIERRADRWTITLDRPAAANALSADMVDELADTVALAEAAGVDALVFRGSGRNLSAGFDLGHLDTVGDAELLQRFVRVELLLQAIANSACCTIGLAHGRNFGAGVDLFAACRWRVAAEAATFRMPGLAFGLVLGTRRFAALVGGAKAAEILGTLQTFDSAEAQRIGFVQHIVAPDAWPATVDSIQAAAGRLTREHRATLHATLASRHDDTDLAALVRSAARPGLKQRMQAYVAMR